MSVRDQGFNGNICILNNSQTPLKSFQLHVVWVLNFIALNENDNRVCGINQASSSKGFEHVPNGWCLTPASISGIEGREIL